MSTASANKAIYLAAGAVGILLVLWLVLRDESWSWVESYRPDEAQPYDVSVTFELMKRARAEGELVLVEDTLLRAADTLSGQDWSYFFLGNYAYLDSAEQKWLLDFVANGNDAMIISPGIPTGLLDSLLLRTDAEWVEEAQEEEVELSYWIDEDGNLHEIETEEEDWTDENQDTAIIQEEKTYHAWDSEGYPKTSYVTDTLIHLVLEGSDSEYPVYSVRENLIYEKRWTVFENDLGSRHGAEWKVEGRVADQPNFIRVHHGKGRFWFHTTPLAFSNYHLSREQQFDYAAAVLDRVSGRRILWDRFNAKFDFNWNEGYSPEDYEPKDGPLSFVLAQKSLRWAWFLLLATALLYLLLGMKRKQRPIPVIHHLPNTSIKFASTLSQLYLKQNDHRKLCMLKWRLFLDHVREQYGIPTHFRNDEERDKLIRRIAVRSGWSEERMKDLFDQYRHITIVYVVDDDLLYDFHHKLNTFYRESK